MDMNTYHQQLERLKNKIVNLGYRQDSVDPSSDEYELITNEQIAVQNELIALDNKYNSERAQ